MQRTLIGIAIVLISLLLLFLLGCSASSIYRCPFTAETQRSQRKTEGYISDEPLTVFRRSFAGLRPIEPQPTCIGSFTTETQA